MGRKFFSPYMNNMRTSLFLLPLIALFASGCATRAPRPIVGMPLPRKLGAPENFLIEAKPTGYLNAKDLITENGVWKGVAHYWNLQLREYELIRGTDGQLYQREGRLWHRVGKRKTARPVTSEPLEGRPRPPRSGGPRHQ